MNKVILMGRLTRDPETRWTTGENSMAIARYSLAVDRRGKDKEADFIPCVAFGKAGEFADKYFHQGQRVLVSGRIQTGSYTNKEGQKVYTTDVIIEDQEFADSKQNASESPQSAPKPQAYQQSTMDFGSTQAQQGWTEVDDVGLPFN